VGSPCHKLALIVGGAFKGLAIKVPQQPDGKSLGRKEWGKTQEAKTTSRKNVDAPGVGKKKAFFRSNLMEEVR